MYRHLSSSTSKNYPLPVVVFTLADMFGFTGGEKDEQDLVKAPADDWIMDVSKEDRCVIVAQVVPNALS